MRRIALVLLALHCAACGGPAVTVTQTQSSIRGRVGVLVLVPNDKFEVYEQNLLTLSAEENTYSFAGFWDPGPTAENIAVSVLVDDYGFVADPIRDRLEPAAYREVRQADEAAFDAGRAHLAGNNEGTSSMEATFTESPPSSYFESGIPDDLRMALWRLGYRHLLEITVDGISMQKLVLHGPQLRVFAYGRLIRLVDSQTVWTDGAYSHVGLKDVHSYEDLEADGLRLMKDYYAEAVSLLLEPGKGLLESLPAFPLSTAQVRP